MSSDKMQNVSQVFARVRPQVTDWDIAARDLLTTPHRYFPFFNIINFRYAQKLTQCNHCNNDKHDNTKRKYGIWIK